MARQRRERFSEDRDDTGLDFVLAVLNDLRRRLLERMPEHSARH